MQQAFMIKIEVVDSRATWVVDSQENSIYDIFE